MDALDEHGLEEAVALTSVGRVAPAPAVDLIAIVQRLSLTRTHADVQRELAAAAQRLAGADGAILVLRDGAGARVQTGDRGPSPPREPLPPSLEDSVIGWVIRNRQAAVVEDLRREMRLPLGWPVAAEATSVVVLPIRRIAPIGVLGVSWVSLRRPAVLELALLQALADATAIALENVRVYGELDSARLETLQRLALAAEFRDDATHQHTQRVGRTVRLLARAFGPAPELDCIDQAALLHDIGKLGVPDAILLKPGPLTVEEFELVKGHTRTGAAMLAGSRSAVLRLASEIACTHHEWWNGRGYPAGLEGEAIPLSGRIVAVADVFDALTHRRPYKRAWTIEDSVAEIHRSAGTQFDPRVIDAFDQLDPESLVSVPTGEASSPAFGRVTPRLSGRQE
jgi:GAF domain-containing protein